MCFQALIRDLSVALLQPALNCKPLALLLRRYAKSLNDPHCTQALREDVPQTKFLIGFRQDNVSV